MISYLGSLDQFSPAAGRAGRCRQMSLCVGSTRRALARHHGERPGQPEVCAPCLLPPRPQRSPVGSQEVFRQEPGPVCRVGGGGFSGAVCPLPLPLPPSSSGGGAALLWSFSAPLFCEPLAVCSSQLIFPLSHGLKKASLPSDCSQGLLAGPHPKQCRRLLSAPPPLAGGGCGRQGYFSAGSCF